MSTRQLLLSNFGGLKEVAHFDETRPDDLLIKTMQDCEPIIEAAKVLSEMTPGKEFRHVGLIPMWVLDQSHREGWFNDKDKWRKWANDPDNKKFRTWPGRI
jgi:hypothetical protein